MTEKNKKLIIFDFDGVFNRNSMEAYYHTYDVAFRESGVSLEPENQRAIIDREWGASHREIISALLAEVVSPGGNPAETQIDTKLQTNVVEIYEEVLAQDFTEIIKPIHGVDRMLGRLAAKYKLALNTAADPEVLLGKVMPKLKIEPTVFEGGMMMALDFADDDLAKPKPDPYATLQLMERNEVQPHETIMVGDSEADILSALQAEVEDIYVPLTGKMNAEEAQEWGVETLPDVTYLEQKLGWACLSLRMVEPNFLATFD